MSASSDSPVRNVRWEDRYAVVQAAGDINAERVPAFLESLLAVLDEKPERIVVNLQDVGYMDSAGLASLVKVLSRARKGGMELHLTCMGEMIRGLFEITRLDSVFQIHESEQEALA